MVGSDREVVYHGHSLGHVIHAVGCIRPGLDDDLGTRREVKQFDLVLHPLVGHAGGLHLLHISGVDMGVLSMKLGLLGDLVLVEVDLELEQPVGGSAGRNNHLDACTSRGGRADGLLAVLLFEEVHHLSLGRLFEGDDAEVGVLPGECWANNLGCLLECQ